ncbi:hypothetical protein E4U43_005809, partial [Claviceps pusilla]
TFAKANAGPVRSESQPSTCICSKTSQAPSSAFSDAETARGGGHLTLDDGATRTVRPDYRHRHHRHRHRGDSGEVGAVEADSSGAGKQVSGDLEKKKKKKKKRRLGGAPSPFATTSTSTSTIVALKREGALPLHRARHRRVTRAHLDKAFGITAQIPCALSESPPFWPFWGCNSAFESASDMATPLLSLSDIDWGSDDDGGDNYGNPIININAFTNANINGHSRVDQFVLVGTPPLAYPGPLASSTSTTMSANRVS